MQLRTLLLLLAFLAAPVVADAQTVYVYGPGGPAPAMHAVASAFTRATGIRVLVTAGPTPAWRAAANRNADLFFSGSENMMTSFIGEFPTLDAATAEPLYIRPAAILVHPGNPKHIDGFRDLLRPGIRVMVVNGAGQVGLWEDIAGRDGSLTTIRRLRRNIVAYASNSAAALALWRESDAPDAWIIYNIWSIAHPGVAQIIPLGKQYAIARDMGVAYTRIGKTNLAARRFRAFLTSPAAKVIFTRFGWSR